jgi:hypothetical protein
MTKNDPNTKTVDALYARLETTVEPDLINGGHAVRLNPDADRLPGTLTTLTARQARLLARDLLFQADEADRRSGVELSEPSDEVIIATAGEYWDHYGHADPDGILSTVQFGAIGRAVGQYQMDTEGEDEDMIPLLLWVHGQDQPGVALTAEVLFAGEARLDALSTPVPAPAGLEPICAALAAGVITEARVTDAAGTVIYDSREA